MRALFVLVAFVSAGTPNLALGKSTKEVVCPDGYVRTTPISVLVIGDSLSAFPGEYPDILRACGVQVINLSKGGMPTYWMERKLKKNQDLLSTVDAVIVFGGHNNFGRKGTKDVLATKESLAEIYRLVGKRKLFALTLSPFGNFDWLGGCLRNRGVTKVTPEQCSREARQLRGEWQSTNDWIRTGADELLEPDHVVNVEMLLGSPEDRWTLQPQFHGRDGLHFSHSAHVLLTKAIIMSILTH
ncbi:MAG: hypothetical protein COV59_02675 [Candidatus Magasanikbacteria bacterium CG11_big_fil_rev_8_21_14_0_20_39_34]|uniref:SGNH hydrolase-type esterase domain-containing protein n=1 Tax=Candidatus Magasanikbacteria bacterium CG11_big_fil_rev_8_21_14_0_20_39_34 TaxID=1974653 RepID=A0A2H0N586_9BACT|nr:MAG: hypothetical protein COV59_02675 [Candidatus Magasanikbacteria bacterium CG11_big_fil_rev_8_21_14_0_20_39_34]